MLPTLITRGVEEQQGEKLLEATITSLFSFYENGIPDDDYRRDTLDTIGKALMSPNLWDAEGESISAQKIEWIEFAPPQCNGILSASLFYCLSHLQEHEIESWTDSILSIGSVYFRAHFLSWFAAAQNVLSKPSSLFSELTRREIDTEWENSFLLRPMFIPVSEANRKCFLQTLQRSLSTEEIELRSKQIAQTPSLWVPFKNSGVAEIVDNALDSFRSKN